ncbi:Metallo-dependent phosphatase-like protein [Mrakia frigida]|uniref:Metallo-dependent phosphatase-like protein n=1 Tax=Mrakia frigida TaxID=29902 RepID=UPI003FCC1FDA
MPTSPLLPNSTQPPNPPLPLHRRLSTPASSKQHPRTRTPSPSYGATSGWDEVGETYSSSPKSDRLLGWRRKGSAFVVFAFLLGVFALSFFSTDEEGAAGWFGGGHDAKKGSNPLVPSPHSHFLNVASLPSHSLTSSISKPSHRLIIVGDIHGSIAPLKKLLKKLNYQPKKDVLLHVGDTVAKGPDPLEVLALLRKYEVMGVRGNHDQPVIEWRSWMEHVLPGGWPFAELDEWSESYARKKAGYLPMDGEKFKWQGEHFEIARLMTKEDYKYLLSLPLVLHLPSLSTHIVHAGLLPVDPTLPRSSPPPAWQLPDPKLPTSTTLNQTSRELLLLTSIPQNTVPWNVLNMRSIDDDGIVSQETLEDAGWSEVWNEVMEECRKRGGPKTPVEGKMRLGSEEQEVWEIEEESEEREMGGEGEVDAEKKKNEKGGKKHKKEKHEISCEPISIIYGHAAGRGLDLKKHSFGLDSGCVYGRRLSALVLGDLTTLDLESSSWMEKGDLKRVMVGKNEGRVVGLDCELGE